MKALFVVALAIAALLLGPAGGVVAAPAGYATGGVGTRPLSQYEADKTYRAECQGTNSLLVFRVRGSGERYGEDALKKWASTIGTYAVRQGWRVRFLQGIYPAPGTEEIRSVDTASRYLRDSLAFASGTAKLISAAHARCPARKILIGGYSSGNIVLRYALNALAPEVRRQIVGVDLVADPTADRRVDGPLAHPAALAGRLTKYGAFTRILRVRAPSYVPRFSGANIAQFCIEDDLVCDATANVASIMTRFRPFNLHGDYAWPAIGLRSARRLGPAPAGSAPGGGGAPTGTGPVAPPTPGVPTTGTPSPGGESGAPFVGAQARINHLIARPVDACTPGGPERLWAGWSDYAEDNFVSASSSVGGWTPVRYSSAVPASYSSAQTWLSGDLRPTAVDVSVVARNDRGDERLLVARFPAWPADGCGEPTEVPLGVGASRRLPPVALQVLRPSDGIFQGGGWTALHVEDLTACLTLARNSATDYSLSMEARTGRPEQVPSVCSDTP